MDNPNLPIAYDLEKLVPRVCSRFGAARMGVTEYLILNDAELGPDWFVVIFFQELSKIREALKSGACFELYNSLLDAMDELASLNGIPRHVRFEKGQRPLTKRLSNELFRDLLDRQKQVRKNEGVAGVGECANCGHDLRAHQLMSFRKDGRDAKEGWTVCPDEGCTCFQAWRLD